MTNEKSPMNNEPMIEVSQVLFAHYLEHSMHIAQHSWFNTLFNQVRNNPNYIVNEDGATIWMLWNQICDLERIDRKDKSIRIERILQAAHADDCNYLRTLYKRGGVELLKRIRTNLSTDININARDKYGQTILNVLLDEPTTTIDDIKSLRDVGYRFGFKDTETLFQNYYYKTYRLSQKETGKYKLFYHFIKEYISDARERGLPGDLGYRFIVFKNEKAIRAKNDEELNRWHKTYFYSKYNQWPKIKHAPSDYGNINLDSHSFNLYNPDFIDVTTYLTLDDIINKGDEFQIDKNVKFIQSEHIINTSRALKNLYDNTNLLSMEEIIELTDMANKLAIEKNEKSLTEVEKTQFYLDLFMKYRKEIWQ